MKDQTRGPEFICRTHLYRGARHGDPHLNPRAGETETSRSLQASDRPFLEKKLKMERRKGEGGRADWVVVPLR